MQNNELVKYARSGRFASATRMVLLDDLGRVLGYKSTCRDFFIRTTCFAWEDSFFWFKGLTLLIVFVQLLFSSTRSWKVFGKYYCFALFFYCSSLCGKIIEIESLFTLKTKFKKMLKLYRIKLLLKAIWWQNKPKKGGYILGENHANKYLWVNFQLSRNFWKRLVIPDLRLKI